jgi:alkanesulfonate monooxygenase SsuD/methylene tetrahydromethanopterin reductase-like flavin-dependent oxidoreductase (luciferase family)
MRIGYLIDTNKGGYDQPLPNREDAAATLDAMIEEGILAEQAGFHSLQVPERHGRTESYFGSPLNLLMILAHETDKVALGSYCLINTLYHPMQIAEQCAIIDNISQGRLYMTWGRGYHSGYWGQFGVPEQRLLGRFLDSVRLIKKALESRGQRFDWDSDFYQVRDGLLSPNCYQQPRFPFWGSGQFPASIERCGTYADFERAAAEFGSHFVSEMRFYCEKGILAHHPEFDSPDKITIEAAREHIVIGSPAQCRERLEWYHEDFGVDYFTMRFRMVTGPSFEATREQILRFGEEVVQPLHKKYPPIDHPAIPKACRW